ncbi:MAG TPA: efflux RND transporter periplasmic adaptor subunit [Myxococcota bacterium]|nr:efflux RND transporter periplasmic adaptor subunit [Myxococcota bacterium]
MFPLTAFNTYAPVPKLGRHRQMRDLAVIIAASAVTAFTLYGCGGGHNEPTIKESTSEAKAVTMVEAVAAPTPRYLTLTGTLNGNRSSEVAADWAGKVVETMVERGQQVAKGQALVRLDPRTASLNAQEAGATAAASEASLTLARSDCERASKLYATNAISSAEFDRLTATCNAQGKQAEAAIARARLAGQQLGDATVRAPFAGMIAQRYVDDGEYVGRDTKIVSLVELDQLRLELNVPEADARYVQVGQAVRFDVAGFDKQTFAGVIKYVGPSLRMETRDLVVEAVIDNHDRVLRPGNFAIAKVTLGEVPTPVVPRAAIRDDGETYRIFVVRDAGKGQQLEERLVQLGPELAGGLVAVAKGVEAGERVVATVTDDLRDGVQVTVVKQAAAPTPPSAELADGAR